MKFDIHEILRTFSAETDGLLAQMEDHLLQLEARGDDEELLGALLRAAHTIKGNALSLELTPMADLAHAAEEVFQQVRRRTVTVTSETVSLLLVAVDTLRHMLPDAVAGRPLADARPLVRQLLAAAEPHASDGEPRGPAQTTAPRTKAPEPGANDGARSLRVDLDKLDRMLNITGEVAIARGRMRQLLESQPSSQLSEVFDSADRLLAELQQLVMDVRLVPLKSAFRQFFRTVRDTASRCGKQAALRIEGDEVEADNTVLEGLRDPVVHLIRNAIAHGIEAPPARLDVGKPACGRITLRSRRESSGIVLQISDDGTGLDCARIRQRALSQGLIDDGQTIDDKDLVNLVFRPGFSTAEVVNELAGRGVGMDAVRRGVEALRGSVELSSEPGKGTTVTIRLPLTVAIVDGFVVSVGDETFVLPMSAVSECLQLDRDTRWDQDGRAVMSLREQPLPLIHLAHVLEVDRQRAGRQHVIVVRSDSEIAGLVVDQLHGESQAVIKPLGGLLRGRPCIAGSTILGNGKVALILDVPLLLRDATAQCSTPRQAACAS